MSTPEKIIAAIELGLAGVLFVAFVRALRSQRESYETRYRRSIR